MKLNIMLLAIVPLLVAGCITLESQVRNDPMIQTPNGSRVFITVQDREKADITASMVGRQVAFEAGKWLVNKGYEIVPDSKTADSTLVFTVFSRDSKLYVPARTWTTPVYDNVEGRTIWVTNNYGHTVVAVHTEPHQRFVGYQTYYREAYSKDIKDEVLLLNVWRPNGDKPPILISEGRIKTDSYDDPFFSHDETVNKAIKKIMSESVFGTLKRK